MELSGYYINEGMGEPKDELNVAEYLKKDGATEADYRIVQLFLDPAGWFYDKEWGMKYMRQATNRGCREAQNCLRLLNIDSEEVFCEKP